MIHRAIKDGDYVALAKVLEREQDVERLRKRLMKGEGNGNPSLFQQALISRNWPIVSLLSRKSGLDNQLRYDHQMTKFHTDNMLTDSRIPKPMLRFFVDDVLTEQHDKNKGQKEPTTLNAELSKIIDAIDRHRKQVKEQLANLGR